MALDNTDLKAILDAIAKERSNSSMFNAGQDTGIKDLRDVNERNADANLQVLKDILDGSRQNTKDYVKGVNKAFKDSNITTEIKGLKDVMLAGDQAKAMQAVAAELRNIKTKEFATQEEAQKHLDELNSELEKVGISLSDFGDNAAKVAEVEGKIFKDEKGFRIAGAKNAKELDEQADTTVEALENASRAYDKHSERVRYSKQAIGKFGNAVKAVAKEFFKFAEQEQRFQQASATADAGWIEGITQLGVSQLDYAKILKDTRIQQLAMSSGGVDFKASLKASADSLEHLTPDLLTAGKVAAQFHKNMSSAGVSQANLGDAVQQQTKLYEKNYRALGFTAEEFGNLSAELINSQGMRNELLTLQESERKQYVLTIQRRQAEYMTMGYSIERAKELQNTFQAINKMSPKSRMKQAAQQRAMMGAMGMGAEGAEMFNLQIRMRTMKADDRAAAELRLTEIKKQASKRYGEMSGAGAGLGQSMVFQTMAEKTGFDSVAEAFEAESQKGREIDDKQLTQLNEINSTISSMLKWKSMFDAASGSSVGSIGTTALLGGGSFLAGMGGKKLASFAASRMGGMFGGGSGAGAGAAAMEKAASTKAAAEAAFKGSGKTAGKTAASGALKKGLTKAAGKSALRAIPGVGMLVGLGLAAHRLSDGDYLGAALELGAGAASLIPGVGTAGSLALSAGLVAHDVMKSDKPDDMEELATGKKELKDKAKFSMQATLEELSITMKSLNEYMRTNGDLSTEQLSTISRATDEIKTNRHYAGPNGARSAQ